MDQRNNQYNYPSQEEMYYKGQKITPRSYWRRHPWIVLFMGLLTTLVIILTSTTIYLLANRAPNPGPSIGVNFPPTRGTSVVQNPAPTSLPSPIPATNIQTLSENLSIPCVSTAYTSLTCNDAALDIQLDTIMIDPTNGPQGRSTWNFTVTNRAPQPATIEATYNLQTSISLTDRNGTNTNADGGTLINASNMGASATLQLTATFPFAPVSNNSPYLLNISMNVSRNYQNGANNINAVYKTEEFKF